MCGIVGYAGYGDAKTFLLRALNNLEYRGYDSAGIAAMNGDGITTIKRAGRVSALEETINGQFGRATTGIAHTRWATHGSPTDVNAHPHLSYDGKVAIAHNGIIENHTELRRSLAVEGIEFKSETDSEAVAHMIARYMEGGDSLLEATQRAGNELKGLSVILAISESEPDAIVGIRIGYAGSLILGEANGARILASNAMAMPPEVTTVTHIDHCEAVRITRDDAEIVSVIGAPMIKSSVPLQPENRITEIGEYAHFMQKEISEQAAAVQGAMRGRIDFSKPRIDIPELDRIPDGLDRIILAGMGTSHFAAMAGSRWIERLAQIPTTVEYAGELADREPVMGARDLLIAVTQSGETYDTLVAIETAKRKGSTVGVVTASSHSEATRMADFAIDIGAGVEVAVPSTKTFINSMLVLYMMGLQIGSDRGQLSQFEFERQIESIVALPRAINRTIGQEARNRRSCSQPARWREQHADARAWRPLPDRVGRRVEDEGDGVRPRRGLFSFGDEARHQCAHRTVHSDHSADSEEWRVEDEDVDEHLRSAEPRRQSDRNRSRTGFRSRGVGEQYDPHCIR